MNIFNVFHAIIISMTFKMLAVIAAFLNVSFCQYVHCLVVKRGKLPFEVQNRSYIWSSMNFFFLSLMDKCLYFTLDDLIWELLLYLKVLHKDTTFKHHTFSFVISSANVAIFDIHFFHSKKYYKRNNLFFIQQFFNILHLTWKLKTLFIQ